MLYSFSKNVLKKLLPQKFLFENEIFFRSILIPLYKGSAQYCNLCNTALKQFEVLENHDLLCPICGSISRTRRLDVMLESEFLKADDTVLDFSPSRALYRKLKKNKKIQYFSTDFENEFLADYHFDITQIDQKQETFDLIICFHILEHIEDDAKAISELYRVLKFGGNVLIQTPFKEGGIFEDDNIKSKQDRLKHFGQEDHVRIYSVDGLCRRLHGVGFQTEVLDCKPDEYFGLKPEKIIVAKKQPN